MPEDYAGMYFSEHRRYDVSGHTVDPGEENVDRRETQHMLLSYRHDGSRVNYSVSISGR
jgi:hypothetical protein